MSAWFYAGRCLKQGGNSAIKEHFLGAAALSPAAFAVAITPSTVAGSLTGVSATADPAFTGVCTLSGNATFSPNTLTVTSQSDSYSFSSNGICTGALNGAPVTLAMASASTSGSDTLGCSASISTTGLDVLLNPHLGELGSIGPVVVIVPTPFGPFPVTVCGNPCPVPVLPDGSIDGSVTVTVTAGSTTVSRTVPVQYP